ncbi:MAG: aldose 1-epimerase family protein [Jatrophihabitans sp.]|uniref:aldose 1-epimerase family protein n=1 Tax=Jatrophihabitans sp. TaxID=1932789 RepID=UPI003F7EB882
MALTGEQYSIAAGRHRATVVEVGAGLRGYTVGGELVTGSYGADVLPPKGCGITLVPWPNRIRDGKYSFDGRDHQLALTEPKTQTAIHGLGRWERWTPVRQTRGRITLALDVVPQTGYPWPVHAEITYALHAERGLTVTFTATNTGSTRIPFGAGAHPYLSTRGRPLDETTVKLPAATQLTTDDQQIPTGRRSVKGTPADLRRGRRLGSDRFDHGFTDVTFRDGRAVAEVRTRAGGAQLWVDEQWTYLQLFTLDALGDHGPAVAIEPMTCAPDAFNSGDGLIVLEPGQRWSGSWGIIPA